MGFIPLRHPWLGAANSIALIQKFFKIKSYTRRDIRYAIAGTEGANLPEPPHFNSIRKNVKYFPNSERKN